MLGSGAQGQLGNGTTAQQFAPTQVSNLTDEVEVYGGYGNTTCVLTSSNGVKCWGRNSEGELGAGSISTYSLTPVQVSGPTSGVASLSVGQYHACVRLSSGGVKCWGSNSYPQLSNDVGSYTATPTAISGFAETVTGVSAGYRSTCVNTTNGAQCWGDNTYGQLGDGTTNSAGGHRQSITFRASKPELPKPVSLRRVFLCTTLYLRVTCVFGPWSR